MILRAVEDVKDTVVRLQLDLTSRFDGLDQKFMPRAEYEARHSDLRNTVTQLDGALKAEGVEREKLEEKLTTARRFGWTTAIAAAAALIALLAVILAYVVHH